ncbi:MAG TPA: FKBP-type peptidyl-prolyl cis-trans isomerase [Pirellulales bacterium]|jgi:FKBP-type peptidyl-prolyl cis-trans isomerase FklB|nr:FKBP-type peptidyl-prolyl cis-trans isomerase [Pirellulales bacterium]
MRLFVALALILGLGTALAQAADPPAKGAKGKPAAKPPSQKLKIAGAEDDAAPQDDEAEPLSPAEMKALVKKFSYIIGMNMGRNMKGQGVEIDTDELVRGMQTALDGKESELSDEEMQKAGAAYERAMVQKQTAKNKEFLAANKKKEGVKVTPSGLQYKVLKSGKGKTPKATDTVLTHYKGTFVDGTVFDSSAKHGDQPASFPVKGVIAGWTEALQMMKIGDKWQLVVPSNLAYGPQGRPGAIPPNTTLIFEMELVGIEE